MSSKVVLLKYVPRIYDYAASPAGVQINSVSDKTAIVIKREGKGFLSIQGYSPVHHSEKHKAWSLFQHAAKQLLGIPRDTAICTRFADPPYEIIGSMSALLHQPSHLINLVVQPIHVHCKTVSSSHQHVTSTVVPLSALAKDPYCAFREMYCTDMSKCKPFAPVGQKCGSLERNRLISQLDDVRICLHRTQQECELIEKRCTRNLEKRLVETSRKDSGSNFSDETGRKMEHSISSLSRYSSDSGKGSISDTETLERVEEEEEEGNCKHMEEITDSQKTADDEVERLLQIAQRLTQHVQDHCHRKKGSTCSRTTPKKESAPSQGPQFKSSETPPELTSLVTSSHPASGKMSTLSGKISGPSEQPDAPSGVAVKPSFRHGGIYVMWNPVSIDGRDVNHGYKVLGYQVNVNQRLCCRVVGALASQVELTGMKDGSEYMVQVCTECEGCSSLLTALLIYRHQETNTPLTAKAAINQPDKTLPPPSLKTSPNLPCATADTIATVADDSVPRFPDNISSSAYVDHSKVAKVHTWLKNTDLDQLQSVHANGHTHSQDSASLNSHTSLNNQTSLNSHTSTNNHTSLNNHSSLHVHFADEEACDDAKSIGSSHTSGIVTDFPMSPKLVPYCCCRQCSSPQEAGDFPCHSVKLGMPSSCEQQQQQLLPGTIMSGSITFADHCDSSSESTLRPPSSIPTPAATLAQFSAETDEPPMFLDAPYHSSTPVKTRKLSLLSVETVAPSHKFKLLHNPPILSKDSVQNKGKKQPLTTSEICRKCPEAPMDVRVSPRGRRGEYLAVSWKPVRRDKKGCSNGYYVLGYRIYVNGNYWQSVDGALTTKTSLLCAAISNLQHVVYIHIRTRSMSAESIPSKTVIYEFRQHNTLEKVSSSPAPLLETYV